VKGAILMSAALLLLGGCASQMVSIRTVPDQTPAADNAAAAANAAAFAEAAAAESSTAGSAKTSESAKTAEAAKTSTEAGAAEAAPLPFTSEDPPTNYNNDPRERLNRFS
jgi:hypothetical protein